MNNYTFAIVPKGDCEGSSTFWREIIEGCQDRAREFEEAANNEDAVRCECVGSDTSSLPPDTANQSDILNYLVELGYVDGIAISVVDPEQVEDSIAAAVQAGIPVVTFDSDAPNSKRSVYIGTDNTAMGQEMGKVLKQLRPEGGSYAMVSATSQNLQERERGLRETLQGTRWTELPDTPLLSSDDGFNSTATLEEMAKMAEAYPDTLKAFLPMFAGPMENAFEWRDFSAKYRHRIAFVGTDWSAGQLELLSRGYVHGLVGQLPYEMGEQSMSAMWYLRQNSSMQSLSVAEVDNRASILGTNLIEILRVPLNLPPIEYDYNYLGNLVIVGYLAFSVAAALALGFAGWTFARRNAYVVKASQPGFLYLICCGALILSSSIIVFSMDDENYSNRQLDIACMAGPWLASMGFVLVFTALFSKTWRVNRIFHNPNKFRRMTVKAKDVILPLVLMMGANVVVLACWTALSPVRFVREESGDTDLWNRNTSSYGRCQSAPGESSLVYLVLIGLINFGALVIACVQAYRARDIQTEFSESKYIALVFASMVQAAVIGGPILALDQESPSISYIIQTVLVFVLSVVILLLMFIPKILSQRERDSKGHESKVRVTGLPATDPPANPSGANNPHPGEHQIEDLPASGGLKLNFWKKTSQTVEMKNQGQPPGTSQPKTLSGTKTTRDQDDINE